jgi:hypothetical protein
MYGGTMPNSINFNLEKIKKEISKFKENRACFSIYGHRSNNSAIHIKSMPSIQAYKDYLVVFVDFGPTNDYNANRMYLGELTSTQKDLINFRESLSTLSFRCNLLYSYEHSDEEFNKEIFPTGSPSGGVAIGFLPIHDKDAVLEWAKRQAQPDTNP